MEADALATKGETTALAHVSGGSFYHDRHAANTTSASHSQGRRFRSGGLGRNNRAGYGRGLA